MRRGSTTSRGGILAVMRIDEVDRGRMRRLAADLEAGESNDPGTSAQRAGRLDWINRRRVTIGLPPLTDAAPEEELHRRARALGMARVDR